MTELPSLLIAGHSHGAAMGVQTRPGTAAPFLLTSAVPDVVAVGGSWPRDEAYWDMFVAEAANRSPALSWQGNQHQAYFLFAPAPQIDFVLSSFPDLPMIREATWVPEAMLREFLIPTLGKLRIMLDRLTAATPHPVLVVGTPPPKGDETKVRELLAGEAFFAQAAAAKGADLASIPLTPPTVMLKLWQLVQDMMRDECDRAGAIFIAVPDALRTEDGFLPEPYWSTDVTHANAAFGIAFVRHISATLGSLIRNKDHRS